MEDCNTSLKDSSSEPAKFQIAASDDNSEEPDVEVIMAAYVVPPDGGWGWVVVAASFMCSVVVDGIILSCGMLLPLFREEFKASNSDVSWVSSLLGGFYLLVGPFVSALANAYGFRTVCILGAVISSVAFGISYFATSIYYLQLTFGILGGIGFGFIYMPAVIAPGFYFEKRRALATGIAVCGSGVGTVTFAALNNFLIPQLGWRYTLVVYAGITLSCVIFGLAFRPLKPTTKCTDNDLEPPGTPVLMRFKRPRDEQMKQCASALATYPMNSKASPKANLEDPRNERGARKTATRNAVTRTLQERHGGNMLKRYSYPGIVVTGPEPIKEETEVCLIAEPDSKEVLQKGTEQKQDNRVLDNKNKMQIKNNAKESEANGTVLRAALDTGFGVGQCPRKKSAAVPSQPSLLSVEHLRGPSKVIALLTETARPFYRDDIFYSGSVRRLPEYMSSESEEKYHQSVTQLPPMSVKVEESKGHRCECCPTSLTSIISRMFDFSLLSSPTFIVLGVAGFLLIMAFFVPFMFLPGYAAQQGISKGTIATLVSTIGITNTIGRVVYGWISDHPKVDALYVSNFSLMLGGGATMILPVISDKSLFFAYAVAFGVSIAAFASLRPILLVELLGLEKLTNAFGLLLMFQGIAAILGSPVAGALVDLTKTYDISFYVFGGLFALAGVMCIPLRYVKRWEDSRKNKQ